MSESEPYDPARYPAFAVTVDLVVLTVRDARLSALMIRRGEEPFAGRTALPGGFVRPGESLGEAAKRELAEETGLADLPVHLEQLATYGAVDRDPRMRVVSVAYLALAPDLPSPTAGGDAADAHWTPVADLLPDLFPNAADGGGGGGGAGGAHGSGSAGSAGGAAGAAGGADGPAGGRGSERAAFAFDHEQILVDGVERARSKLEYTPLAAAFCPPQFTVGELRRVYEAVWGVELDPRNFHRKVTGTPGYVLPAGGTTTRQGGRPAQLFKRGDVTLLNPPMLRPA
ncbi:NUDIX hydrolase [Actinospica acidithermotolerans]|uniref:NUDIX hydrolase n=1 Tax=Actinospica acidithermotolerans TaxID=2828514 RepID=UPI002012A1D6|nr:NUDIX domain-containing protein [Actinospica acidithermotolerans]